ncbi:MAG: 2-succinyl-5-enolpyruvyl-6-hydroxy-3-cyclohexene-1-carboxylic-acid synthase [Candidatus Binatia bacterium]
MTPGNVLHSFVGAFVDALARSGVSRVCLCPGSRSTPLALLLRRHPAMMTWVHLDERSAAFFALGMAKASREPVVLVATSGTATVNFAPAVVEAYYARVPLLVLTADRPPELRGVGALQTIDQVRLYGSQVKWCVEMPLPETTEEAVGYARTIACRAVATARCDAPGPVHVNFPFREPLIPVAAESSLGCDEQSTLRSIPRPAVTITQAPRRPDPVDLAALAADLRTARRSLIVCGPQDDPHFPTAVAQLAAELEAPLLADPLSQVRCGVHHNSCVIDSYDAFLRDERCARDFAPEIVLRFGATPVSKLLLLYLQRYAACRQVLIEEGDGWHDPAASASEVVYAQPRAWCEALLIALRSASGPSRQETWRAHWQAVARQARATLHEHLLQSADFCEPRVFTELAALLPQGTTVFAGNSMPVRDLDTFFAGGRRSIRFLANRGASGIDGVVSTALGVSVVSSEPLVLVIGDLSFYHDLNGLLAARRYGLRATIILLHNDGGGIFSFLPQAEESQDFEELFSTPHGLDFRPAADMYGLAYQRPTGWQEFRTAVQQALGDDGVTLIEVRTQRPANVELHRRLWKAVSLSVSGAAAAGGAT